jgi:hypothetical protein
MYICYALTAQYSNGIVNRQVRPSNLGGVKIQWGFLPFSLLRKNNKTRILLLAKKLAKEKILGERDPQCGERDPQCQCVVNYPKVIFPFFHFSIFPLYSVFPYYRKIIKPEYCCWRKNEHDEHDPQCQCVVNYPKVNFPFFHSIQFLLSKYCTAEKVASATLSVSGVL